MGTPDRKAGPSNEEGTFYEDEGVTASAEGEVRYASGAFSLYDSAGEFDPRGLNEAQHNALRVLVHLADGGGPWEDFASGAYRETTPSPNPFPTSIIWWETSSKLKKIVEKTITYSGPFPTTIEWKAYDTDGTTVLATVTDSLSYSGPFEQNRTRTIA